MKLLVTGVTGFIGSRLAPRLVERGYAVRGLALARNESEKAAARELDASGVEFTLGSVTDPDVVREAARGAEAAIHLAAAQAEMNVPDQHYRDVNVDGVRALLEACREAGVRRVVHASTIGVYGVPNGVVNESTPCAPANIYGRSKLEGEEVARQGNGEVETVVIRVPEIYGPGDRRLLKLFGPVKRGRFPIIGNGLNIHQPMYVYDLIDGLTRALTVPEAAGQLFVFGGPEELTTNEMAAKVAAAVGVDPPRLRLPMAPLLLVATIMEKTLRPLGIQPPLHRRRLDFYRKSFRIDANKARDVLQFEPATAFEAGAVATAQWYEEQGLI